MRCSSLIFSVFAAIAASTAAADSSSPAPTPEQEQALLKEVRVPEGFEAKIFAVPPAVNYPVFVAAAPDGTVYVSSDRNGSLDRAPHRGRVLRVRDLDGDGHADEVKAFVPDVDSPRGLVWDRDRLYLLHPPHLSMYIDHDGDGVADEEKVLVKNIAFSFKDRPADHSSNGIELGVDGWIYCAIGDFGFMEAEGADGRRLQLRGGGVVRVRPDGTGLELYSRGTRNILEAAVSPALEIFARDNTNDGDGWDIRLHHFSGGSEHGYPSLFKHFKGEFIEPLADYGGGSGCGALFLDEPGFPADYNNALYTADWGREWIYRHHLTPDGGTFKVDQSEFVRAPRVTDLDVDGLGHLYVSSWKGATFTYVGENVGFLARVTPRGTHAEPMPDLRRASDQDLLRLLESASHRRRLAAQRELLARRPGAAVLEQARDLAADKTKLLAGRIAALYLVTQANRDQARTFLESLLSDPSIRPLAVRALCDGPVPNHGLPAAKIAALLKDGNPRVRCEAAYGLARQQDANHASAIAGLLGDADATVRHTAIQALRKLEAADACFAILDTPGSSMTERTNALIVLQKLHTPKVVDGLIERARAVQSISLRRPILTALCRLYFTHGVWKGDSWGTRPDTSGPYYQPAEWSETPKIAAFLNEELKRAAGEDAAFLVTEFGRHKIQNNETLAAVIHLAEADPALVPAALAQLARAEEIPAAGVKLALGAAGEASSPVAVRANAVVALAKLGSVEAARAALSAMPALYAARNDAREIHDAQQAFLRSRKADQHVELWMTEAERLDAQTSPWADAILLNISMSKNASPEARDAAKNAIESGWQKPARKAQILRAIALSENRGARERVIEALDDPEPQVASAARDAAKVLRMDQKKEKAGNGPQLAGMKTEEIIQRVMGTHGDPSLGRELFNRQQCSTCHTISPNEPLRGPFLGNIAAIYKRDELAAAILLPNKTIAQGFTTHHFELKDGTEIDGFVVQEAADHVTVRNVAAQEIRVKTSDIASRSKLERSIMPEGLVANLSLREFASLLDFLQNPNSKQGGH